MITDENRFEHILRRSNMLYAGFVWRGGSIGKSFKSDSGHLFLPLPPSIFLENKSGQLTKWKKGSPLKSTLFYIDSYFWSRRKEAQFHDEDGMGAGENEIDMLVQSSIQSAMYCPECVQIEIGVLWGAASTIMGYALNRANAPDSIHVLAIDPNVNDVVNSSQVIENYNIMGLSRRVSYIRKYPYEVDPDQPISLLFMDGGHNWQLNQQMWDYQMYMSIYMHFEHKLIDGALIIVDDAGCSPHFLLKRFTEELVRMGHADYVKSGVSDNVGCYQITLRKRSRSNSPSSSPLSLVLRLSGFDSFQVPIEIGT